MVDTFDKISLFIENQVPEFIRVEHPLFVTFLEAYYEWLETEGQAVDVIFAHPSNIDIDRTLDMFLEHFLTKYLVNIPQYVLADKRLLAKNIKDFYAARGTEKSYEFLFQILYGKEVDFYYPKDDILIASDGKWTRDEKIFLKQISDDPFLAENQLVTGTISGAQAIVDVVHKVNQGTLVVYEAFVREHSGTFEIGETVTATLGDGTIVEFEICGFVSAIRVIEQGDQYSVGDIVPIVDATGNGFNALGRIAATENAGTITSVDIIDGGSGYRVGDPIVFDESNTDGFGAIAEVSAVTPDSVISVNNDIIGDHQNEIVVPLEFTPINAWLTFIPVTLGAITAIDVIEGGENYDILPTATVGQQTPSLNIDPGVGAVVEPRADIEGAITEIEVLNPGVGYIEHPSWPQADLTGLGDGTAVADVDVSGGPYISRGFYRNLDGHLSSIKYLQDGEYYQLYSYVLKVDESINTYREIVKSIVHPAGTKMFGLVEMNRHQPVNAMVAGICLPTFRSEYVLRIEPVMDLTVNFLTDGAFTYTILMQRPILVQAPIIILPYEHEVIDGYDEVVLGDFVGFTQEKSFFSRSAVVDIL